MKVRFDADTFVREMYSYAERKEAQIRAGLTECCKEVVAAAVPKCPKDSQALRNSITYKVTMHGAKATGFVGSELEHAPYVHEGTGIHSRTGMGRKDVPWSYQDEEGNWHSTEGMEATPFLEEARNESRERILQIMFDALKG